MAIFLQLVVDGNGDSKITLILFLVTCEVGEMIRGIYSNIIIQHASEIRTVLSDNDFTERAVYKQHYSQARLQLCLFHVLYSMNYDIIVKKMKIILEQKSIALEIIRKLEYSSNIEEYNENLVALKKLTSSLCTSTSWIAGILFDEGQMGSRTTTVLSLQ